MKPNGEKKDNRMLKKGLDDEPKIQEITRMKFEDIDPTIEGVLQAPENSDNIRPYIVEVERPVTFTEADNEPIDIAEDQVIIQPEYEDGTDENNLVERFNKAKEDLANFEEILRMFILAKLKESYKEEWWELGIPEYVQKKVINNLEEAKKQDPRMEFDKLTFMDYSDYFSIIMRNKNWRNIFSNIFLDKENVNFPFKRIKAFRNSCYHGRLIPSEFNKYLVFMDEILKFISGVLSQYGDMASKLENLRITSRSEMKLEEYRIKCKIHDGVIKGLVYTCPHCLTFYCEKCATKLKEEGKNCVKCNRSISI